MVRVIILVFSWCQNKNFTFSLLSILLASYVAFMWEGNGNPLQSSCLENPRGRGAWWAVVYGVPQSRTWLKRLGRVDMAFIMLRYFSSIPNLLSIFIMEVCFVNFLLLFLNAFLHLWIQSYDVSFILLVWWVTFLDVHMLRHPWIPEINAIWS